MCCFKIEILTPHSQPSEDEMGSRTEGWAVLPIGTAGFALWEIQLKLLLPHV